MTAVAESPVVLFSKTVREQIENQVRERLGSSCTCSCFGSLKQLRRLKPTEFYYVANLRDISPESLDSMRSAVTAKHRRFLVFLEDMPVEALAERIPHLHVRRPDRLQMFRASTLSERIDILTRFLAALCGPAPESSIVHAWIELEELILLSPRFRRLRVPLAKLASLRPFKGHDRGALEDFRVDPDGSYVHWPIPDVHMGWEQLEQLVSPYTPIRHKQQASEFNRRFGAAIRELRTRAGIAQSRIEGLTERHLRRIEKGEQRATLAALEALADAHDLDTNGYLACLRDSLS